MKPTKPFRANREPKKLSPSDERTLLRISELIYEMHNIDPQRLSDEEKLISDLLTMSDRQGVQKLVAGIRRGDVTEESMLVIWKETLAYDMFYTVNPLTVLVGNIAKAIAAHQ
jgi:hypothetical protein